MITVWIALAGGLGAGCRFMLDGVLVERVRSILPVATLTINVLGSLLLGLLTGWSGIGGFASALLVLGTGFCGGFTTFSTASVELVRLARAERARDAVTLAALMLLAALAAAALGLWLGAHLPA